MILTKANRPMDSLRLTNETVSNEVSMLWWESALRMMSTLNTQFSGMSTMLGSRLGKTYMHMCSGSIVCCCRCRYHYHYHYYYY